jgi:hypothetical protein
MSIRTDSTHTEMPYSQMEQVANFVLITFRALWWMKKGRSPLHRGSGRYRFRERVCYLFVLVTLLDPVAFVVLLVRVLYGAPGDAVGAIFLPVLILC